MKKIIFIFLLSLAFTAKAQISEGFEGGTFPPEGWAAFPGTSGGSDAEWDTQEDLYGGHYGYAHTGEYSAISSFDWEGETEGWIVTPQFTPTEESHTLFFHQRQLSHDDYGSTYTVRVSTESQTTHADFTIVDTQTEEDVDADMFMPHTVDLSAYIDTPIYVAFVHNQDDGDEWYIDDVLTDPIAYPGLCINPTPADAEVNVSITNTQTSQIDLYWDAPTDGGEVLQYDLWIAHLISEEEGVSDLSLIGHPTDMEAHPKTFHFNTIYFWAPAPNNMMGYNPELEGWAFMTSPQPTVTTPYVIDFENEGFVPDACDQFITNQKWWEYAEVPTGHIGNGGSFEGTTTESGGYFAFIDDSDVPNSLNTIFSTPYINFTGIDQPAFSFYKNSNNEGGANVDFSIKMRVIGEDDPLEESIYTSNTNTAGWEKVVVELDPMDCTLPVQFLFVIDENEDSSKDDFAIDDITFDSLSNIASINDQTIEGLDFYPNPVKNSLNIQANETVNKVEIYTLLGQLVLHVEKNATSISIDTSNLDNGNYIVKVFSNNKQNSLKFVKE